MLSKDKIKLMNDISRMEDNHLKDDIRTYGYYKSDYVAKHMWQSLYIYTICYMIITIMRILYNMSAIFDNADVFNVIHIFIKYIIQYFIFLIIYELITFIVYNIRYDHAREHIYNYQSLLDKLHKRYKLIDKINAINKEGN